MNAKETELVTEEFCSRNDTYNICPGGKGGWGYVNKITSTEEFSRRGKLRAASTHKILEQRRKCPAYDEQFLLKMRDLSKRAVTVFLEKYPDGTFKGKSHAIESKQLISEKAKERTGRKNSQHGTMWITDGISNRKLKGGETIPEGWRKGRIL